MNGYRRNMHKIENFGLIDFIPQKIIQIGTPYKYFQNNTVVCLEIENTIIETGDYFAYVKNERWHKVRIISIEQEKKQINETFNGSYGFRLEEAVPKEELFLYRNDY